MGDWKEALDRLDSRYGQESNSGSEKKESNFLERAGTFTDVAGKMTFAKESPTRATVERGLTNVTLGAYPHLKAAVQSVQRGIPYAEALANVRVSQEANEQAFPKATLAGDIGSLAVPTGATTALKKMSSLPAVGNLARRALVAERRYPAMYNAGRGAAVGATEGIRADEMIDGEPSLSFNPMSPVAGGLFGAGITKAPAAAKYTGEKLGQLGRGAVQLFTNTSPELGELINKRPDIYREVTSQGAPVSGEIAQEGIRYIEQILGKDAKPFIKSNQFKKEAEQLASIDIPKPVLLKGLKDLRKEYVTKEQSETKKQVNAIYHEYRRYIKGNKNRPEASASDAMTWKSDLQAKAEGLTSGTYGSMPQATPEATKFTKAMSSRISDTIGDYNPGFKGKMAESARYAEEGEAIKKYLGNANDPRKYPFGEIPIDPQKTGNIFFSRTKVPGIKYKRSEAEEYLTSPNIMNPEQTSKIKDIQNKYLMKKELEARTANGARNVFSGTTLGLSSGYLASRILDTDPVYTALTMAPLGVTLGGAIDKYGAPIAGKMYSGMNKMSSASGQVAESAGFVRDSLKAQFPREFKVLSDAASRGKKRYASTLFIMQQSNPEFSKYVNDLKEQNEQQD